MAEPEITSESVSSRAVEWVSTCLSVALIWPKLTAAVAVLVTGIGLHLIVSQLTRPAVPPAPPLDRARVAAIESAIQQADNALRSVSAGAAPDSCNYQGYLHSISDPSHAEHHHEASRVLAH